jgi:hypothetical protein
MRLTYRGGGWAGRNTDAQWNIRAARLHALVFKASRGPKDGEALRPAQDQTPIDD